MSKRNKRTRSKHGLVPKLYTRTWSEDDPEDPGVMHLRPRLSANSREDPAELEALSKREKKRDEKRRKIDEDANKRLTAKYSKYFEDLALAQQVPVADPNPNGVIGYKVPILTKEEHDSWLEFKELDKGNPIAFRRSYTRDGCDQEKAIDLHHPFVPFLHGFVVDAFNKICVKAGVRENGSAPMDYKTLEVKYLNAFAGYVFQIKLSVREKGISGLDEDGSISYNATVEADRFTGSKTLLRFFVPLDAFCGERKTTNKRQNEVIDILKIRLQQAPMAALGLVKICLLNDQEVYCYKNPLPEFEFYPY